VDPILDSPWASSAEIEAQVQSWIKSFQTREAPHMKLALARMGLYRPAVEQDLRRMGLPTSLAFLPIVESWYNPVAANPSGATGLWQFMAPTARGLGLRVNRFTDERRDPFLSTTQALRYLADMKERFGSWFLALAAYNVGPGRVERILGGRSAEGEGHDGLFEEILHALPRETRDFVPRFLAAGRIGRDPAAFGFGEVEPLPPLAYDLVEVPDAATLDVLARVARAERNVLEALNPQLLRGMTPAGGPTRIRVPQGAGEGFAEAYALLPPEERVSFVEHEVASGETLTHIARRYGVTVEELRLANPRIEPRRMQIGQLVVVPTLPAGPQRAAARGEEGGQRPETPQVYRVRPGDTLGAIALRHGVALADLLRWNGLPRNAVIRPGDGVRLRAPGPGG
jgi:membrane-bound lytic murein transglycosylase D